MSNTSVTPLSIRRSLTLNAVFGVIFTGGALFFAWAIVRRIARGAEVDAMAWLWLLGFGVTAAWALRDAIDRRVQVLLTADGFTDRRTGGTLVPWSAVRQVNAIVANGISVVEFTIGPEDALAVGSDWLEGSGRRHTVWPDRHIVRVVMRNLDASSSDVIAFVRRAAPMSRSLKSSI